MNYGLILNSQIIFKISCYAKLNYLTYLFNRQGNPSVFQNLFKILKDSPPDRGQKFVVA